MSAWNNWSNNCSGSPKLEIYIEQINAARLSEKTARHQFLEKITEDDKAEFINGEVILHSPVKLSHNNCTLRLAQCRKHVCESPLFGTYRL